MPSPGPADGGGLACADAGAAPILGCPLAAFDTAATGLEGFAISGHGDPNLGDASRGPMMMPTLSWDGIQGSPLPGSLAVFAPYDNINQYIDIENAGLFGLAQPKNWIAGKLHARIRADGPFNGGVQLYVLTKSSRAFGGTHANFTTGLPVGDCWNDFSLDVANPTTADVGYDPTQVMLFGIQLSSPSPAAMTAFHLDSISIEGLVQCPTLDGG